MSGPLGPNLLDRLTASAPPPPARQAPTPNLLDKLAAPSPVRPAPVSMSKPAPHLLESMAPKPKPMKAPLKTDAQLLAEEGAKLDAEVWPTHVDPKASVLHNLAAPALYGLKVMGEGFNVVNRALPRFVPGYQNLLDKLSTSVNANEAKLRADDARAQQAIADSYQGAPPAPSSLTAHPPAQPSLTSANPIDQEAARRERARAAAYQQRYSDPRSTETYVQQIGRALSPLGDLADPRLSTYGEDIGEATHNPYLGMALDMLAPAPGAGLSRLTQIPGRLAEFLAGGAKFTKAELLAMRTAQLEESARLADMAQQANASARAGLGRLPDSQRLPEVRRTPPVSPSAPVASTATRLQREAQVFADESARALDQGDIAAAQHFAGEARRKLEAHRRQVEAALRRSATNDATDVLIPNSRGASREELLEAAKQAIVADGPTTNALTRHLGVSFINARGLMKDLEARGFVQRSQRGWERLDPIVTPPPGPRPSLEMLPGGEPNLLDKLSGTAAPKPPVARGSSPEYLASLRPARARKGKKPAPAGQGNILTGPTLSQAPAQPRNPLDAITAPPPSQPTAGWRPAELPGPVAGRLPSPEYLDSLKPQKGRGGKPAAGQGNVFTGEASSAAPALPRNLLDELTAPPPEAPPWQPAELPGPIKPELEYRPGQVDTPRPPSPFRAPEVPAAPAVPYAPDPAAPINPAARMGQVFKAAARRIGFTPEKIARPYGAYLTVGDVEKVFAGTATPEQVKLVTNAIGMEFGPQGFRWTPPRGAKNVSGWNEQLELARAWEIAPPPDRMKSAPMQAGNRAMVANRPPAPKPATFWDDATRPGDLQAGPRSETFMPQELKVDAKAYQFKEGGDAVGVTDALRGVRTWDRSKSGKALVHERLDGNYYIADGHQRLGLATRLTREGQPAALDTLVYREADGYSVADVRRIAAAKNLAEGTGSAIDAAKVAREAGIDHPDLTSIPKSKPIYRDGEQLAKLGDRAFEEVVNGAVKPDYAAHVGRLIQGDAAQLAALKALRRLKPGSSPEALSIVQDIRAQGLASKTEQGGLFGAEETMEDLLGERARIFSAAQSIAATDKNLFRQIVRGEGRFQEAGNVLAGEVNRAQITDAERLLAGLEEAKYRGPVAARLNQLAREVKAGTISEQKAARAFLDSVRSESEVANAARPGAGGPALGPESGRVDLEGVREPVPDIEGQDTFFSMEQGGRLPRRNQGALFPPERQATPKFPEAPKVKGAGQGRLIPEAPKDLNAPKVGERIPAPYDFAGQKVQLGKMEVSRRLPMPALVKLSRSITGQVPDVSKALQSLSKRMGARVNGRFSGGRVEINPDLFANEDMASKVLGHEIGHVIDLIGPQKGQVQAFRSALAAEMRKAPELYREALRLSREWRPYTQAGADARFLKYREAAEEVIADFLSAFLNDAAYAQKTAPQLTQAFFSTLSSRPKVQKALLEVYDMMDGTLADFHGAVAREVDTSFMKAEDLWKAIADERKAREGSFWQRVVDETRYMFSDVGGEAKRRAQRAEDTGGLKGAYDPRVMFDEYGMSGNRTFLMARDWQDGVVAPLREAGLAEAEFGRYLFARRIAQGDRAAQANPLGVTARNAEAILAEMKGKPGFDVLEKAGRKARKLYGQALKDAFEAGAVSREDYQAAKAGAETWADFRLVDDLHKRVSADLKGPGGTFEDVANPATATFMKAAALRNVAEANRARAGMVEFMRSNYANEIRVAKKNELPKFGEASFEVLEDGKKVTYIADRWLADTFDGERFDRLGALARLVTAFDQKFKGLWITFNLGFQMMNVLRDAQRTTRSLSALGVTSRWDPTNILRTFASYGKTLPDAWQYAKGEVTPILREMINDYAIAPPGESVTDILAGDSKLEQELMRTGGLASKPEAYAKGLNPRWNRPVDTALDWALNARRTQREGLGRLRIPLDNTLNFIRELGGTLEAVPKIAGYRRLGNAKITGSQRAANVRDFVGTPNYKIRGAATNITNAAFTFSNIAIQGWKADLRLATGAKTRGAFWLETLKQGIMPKLLMVGGAYGLFGGELQEMFDAISEYDKTQFLCIPFGWEEGGEHGKRVQYLRLPFDETTRFFAGLTWKALNGPRSEKDREDVLSDIFGFAWGQIPGLGPTATMGREFVQVAAGKNPEDEFRGRPKISKTEFEAGGGARWGGYLKASLGNFGMVGEVVRDGIASGSRPSYELTAAGLPGLNRFFRVSDRGFTEIQQQAQHNKGKAKAQLKLGYGDKTKEVSGAFFRLQKLGKSRTRRQTEAYNRARQFYNGPYRHTAERVQRLLDDGHELEADRLQRELEKRAAPYYRDLNKLTGRIER